MRGILSGKRDFPVLLIDLFFFFFFFKRGNSVSIARERVYLRFSWKRWKYHGGKMSAFTERACKSSLVTRSQINDAFSESLSAPAVGTMFYSIINFGRALSRNVRYLCTLYFSINRSAKRADDFSVNNSFHRVCILPIFSPYFIRSPFRFQFRFQSNPIQLREQFRHLEIKINRKQRISP